MRQDKTVKQLIDAGQTELLAGAARESTQEELDRDFGEERNPEVIRNRPNPDPHYGNPGPNPVGPLTKAQQKSVASAAERSPDVITNRSEEDLEEDEEQAKDALKSAGVESEPEKRQVKESHNRRVG